MRRLITAVLTAAGLLLASSAALAAPPEGKGGPAQEQCEEQKPKAKSPNNDEDCDY